MKDSTDFYNWLWKHQRVTKEWFLTMIDDKKPYYREYSNYREKVDSFHEAIKKHECAEVAHELVLLG